MEIEILEKFNFKVYFWSLLMYYVAQDAAGGQFVLGKDLTQPEIHFCQNICNVIGLQEFWLVWLKFHIWNFYAVWCSCIVNNFGVY